MARQAPTARVAPRVGAALLLGALLLFGAEPSAWAAEDSATTPASALRWAERPLPELGCRVVCPTSWRIDGRGTGGSTANAANSTAPAGSKSTAQPATTDADTSAEARANAGRPMVVRLGPPDGTVRASVRRLAGRRSLKEVVARLQAAQRAAGWTAARPPARGMFAGYDAVVYTVTVPATSNGAPALTQRICAIDTLGACFVLTYGALASRYRATEAMRFLESFTLAPARRAGEATASSPETSSDATGAPATGAPTTAESPDPAPRYGCAKCDLDHPKSANYCARCGGPLGTLTRWGCRQCRLVAPREDRFCTRCGHKLERW